MFDAILAGFIMAAFIVLAIVSNISYRRLSEKEKQEAEDDMWFR